MKKKEILELYYEMVVYGKRPLCSFISNEIGDDGPMSKAFKKYLVSEGILPYWAYSIAQEHFREMYVADETEEVTTFRLMVLEDFLTKYGVK